MSTVNVPVSWGELIDKLTILAIKNERITDPAKLHNIRTEMDALRTIVTANVAADKANGLNALESKLKAVNEELWQIEDDIRVCERQQDFGAEFIRLARAVYVTNDQRFLVKREINDFLGSALKEEKSYQDYSHVQPATPAVQKPAANAS